MHSAPLPIPGPKSGLDMAFTFHQLTGLEVGRSCSWDFGGFHVAVGQHQRYHVGVGAPPILVYCSGDWDFHWGQPGFLTHGPCGSPYPKPESQPRLFVWLAVDPKELQATAKLLALGHKEGPLAELMQETRDGAQDASPPKRMC